MPASRPATPSASASAPEPLSLAYQRIGKDAFEEDTVQQMDGTADTPELKQLYADFEAEHLAPLWTQRDDLMPMVPSPKAVPHVWRWKALFDIAERSGRLVPVGRGGERRAMGLANPGLPGTAYATPTQIGRASCRESG